MSRFLSHDKTKGDYLAAKILEYNRGSSKLIITSASGYTRSNKGLVFEENNHKEADTLLIHQAVLASQQNPPDAQLAFFSPHTDVLVLVTPNYHLLLGILGVLTCVSASARTMRILKLWYTIVMMMMKMMMMIHKDCQ